MAEMERDDWVRRVLGVSLPASPAALRAAVAALRDASDAVDGQVAGLQGLLQRSGDAELKAIAEYGMAALSGGNRTRMIAAAMELERSDPPPPALLKRAAAIAASYRAHLLRDPKVRGFDENPFGVPVSIRATLEPALRRLEAAAGGG